MFVLKRAKSTVNIKVLNAKAKQTNMANLIQPSLAWRSVNANEDEMSGYE